MVASLWDHAVGHAIRSPACKHKIAMSRLSVCGRRSSAYLLLPSQVVSICDLQRLALYWFHAPRLQLDNEVSQSTDQSHRIVTVCHQHYGHQTCRRAPSTGHWRRTCSRLLGAIETFSWFWRRIWISRRTYLLTYLLTSKTTKENHFYTACNLEFGNKSVVYTPCASPLCHYYRFVFNI